MNRTVSPSVFRVLDIFGLAVPGKANLTDWTMKTEDANGNRWFATLRAKDGSGRCRDFANLIASQRQHFTDDDAPCTIYSVYMENIDKFHFYVSGRGEGPYLRGDDVQWERA